MTGGSFTISVISFNALINPAWVLFLKIREWYIKKKTQQNEYTVYTSLGIKNKNKTNKKYLKHNSTVVKNLTNYIYKTNAELHFTN